MPLQVETSALFEQWLSYAAGKSIMECEFFGAKNEPVAELLGEFSVERLTAFGEHASGSLIGFYSRNGNIKSDAAPVAWLDGEGSPCIVVAGDLEHFLSVLPYGTGLIYTVAAVIENNPGDAGIAAKAYDRAGSDFNALLEKSRSRFPEQEALIAWLSTTKIAVSADPVKTIIDGHLQNDSLDSWINENLT